MKRKIILIGAVMFVVSACQNHESGAAAGSKGSEAYLTNAGIRIIAPSPAPEGQMALYNKLNSDAITLVTPMPEAGPAVALIGPGLHDMAMVQTECKYTVAVTVKNPTDAVAPPTILNLSMSGAQNVELPGSDLPERRVEIQMEAAAKDNYSCNVMLRNKG